MNYQVLVEESAIRLLDTSRYFDYWETNLKQNIILHNFSLKKIIEAKHLLVSAFKFAHCIYYLHVLLFEDAVLGACDCSFCSI